jgi:arginase
MPRTVSLLGVPSSAGTHGPGQEKAPAALRAAGLVRRLQTEGVRVQDHGDLPTTLFRADPSHRDRQGIERATDVARQVRDAVTKLLEEETTLLLRPLRTAASAGSRTSCVTTPLPSASRPAPS